MLPVINVYGDDDQVIKLIRDASINYGFFYIDNHRVNMLSEVFAASRSFFEQPHDFKQRVLVNSYNLGYTSFDETLNPLQSCPDTKEGYYIESEILEGGSSKVEAEGRCNRWPTADSENFQASKWRHTMLEYHRQVKELGDRLQHLILSAAGITAADIASKFSQPTALLRLLHYGTQVSDPAKGIFAAGEHSDYGLLTLLATEAEPGLQIKMNGKWEDVEPRPSLFVVNLGDQLQRLTNDCFKSTVHRVLNTTGRERYSIAFFYEPNADAVVETLPSFISDANPSRYAPVKYGDYLANKYSTTHSQYKK